MHTFSLVDEPSLTTRLLTGQVVDLSLRDLLMRSHEVDTLVVDIPTQLPALLRQVVLPVVFDALGRPADLGAWARLWSPGEFTEAGRTVVSAYLDQHRDRFNLFDSAQPFAQVAGLRTAKDDTRGGSVLVSTAATGNNVPLFSSRLEDDPAALTPIEALRWLVHAHCWDTAAIKAGAADDPRVKAGKTTGNPVGPLGALGVVIPTGRNLFETIILNLPIGVSRADDRPWWRREPMTGTWEDGRTPAGPLELWTWQARRIRLIPDDTPDGNRVRRVVLTAGDRMAGVPEWEPHTAWTFRAPTKGRTGPVRRPRRHTPGRAIWRGLDALLALEREDQGGEFETTVLLNQIRSAQAYEHIELDYPLRVETVGMTYGNQSAVVEDSTHDAMPLPVAALRSDSRTRSAVLEVCEGADALTAAVNNLSSDLRRACGGEPIPWNKGQRPGELVLHAVDPIVRRFLAGVRSAADDADTIELGLAAWEDLARRVTFDIAESLFTATPPGAFGGRDVRDGNQERTYRMSTAELNFYRRVREILPRAAKTRTRA